MFTVFVPKRIVVRLKISLPQKSPDVEIGSSKPVSMTKMRTKRSPVLLRFQLEKLAIRSTDSESSKSLPRILVTSVVSLYV